MISEVEKRLAEIQAGIEALISANFAGRWLKLREAAVYSGIGRKRLIEMARAGKIKGGQDTDSGKDDWFFDRLSIDEYRQGQIDPAGIRNEALAIMRGVAHD